MGLRKNLIAVATVVAAGVSVFGTPSAYDRVLCTRLGLDAVDAIVEKDFGKMLAVRLDRIERVPLSIVNGKTRTIDVALYQQVADVFFG